MAINENQWPAQTQRYDRHAFANRPFERNDYRLNVDLPHFFGNIHIEDFLDWFNTIEQFFDYSEISEEKKVKLIAYKLTGGCFSLVGANSTWKKDE